MQVEVEDFILARGSTWFQRCNATRCLLNSQAFMCVKGGARNDIYRKAQPPRTADLNSNFRGKIL